MCMNCGCGNVDERHKPTDIVRDDLQKAADGGGLSVDEVATNLRSSLETMTPAGGDSASSGSGQQQAY